MRPHWIALAVLAGPHGAVAAQQRVAEVYTVDQAHSLLDFTVRLVGFNRVRGSFGTWRADFAYDPAAPASGYVSFLAEVASIATQVEERDRDLKGAEFFDVARFPRLSFEGHVASAAGATLQIEGRLTIRDSTRTIRFPLELVTPEATDPFGNRRLVFAGKVTLNRRDFGVVGPRFWNHAISDSVAIEMELAGRIWGYSNLGFRRGSYYAPALVAAAGSGRFPEVSRRLARVLELFAGVAEARWRGEGRSSYETRLGEVLVRMGRLEEARRHLDRALTLNPANTNARAWLASTARTP